MADDPITWQSLATVSGASGASGMLVGFIKVFVQRMPAAVTRMLAAVFGVLLVELAVVVLGATGWKELVLGLLSGVAAGLAASKAVEVGEYGPDHEIASRDGNSR